MSPRDPNDLKTRLNYLIRRAKGESETQARWRAHNPQTPTYVPIERTETMWATQGLFGLCVLYYFLQSQLGGGLIEPFTRDENGMRLLASLGAIWSAGPGHPFHYDQQPWRLVTYSFMHGGFMHIAFNCMALLQIGPLIERSFGLARTLFFWVVTGALAILLPALIFGGQTHMTVGGSGSIFGLIGVAMAYGHRLGTPEGIFVRNKMIEWTVICTMFGMMMGGVAHSAHFGGLFGGIILSFVISPARQRASSKQLGVALLLSSLALILWSFYEAYHFALEVL